MGFGDSIVVNEFMLCTDHGREYFPICCCDFREVNNISIEGDLADLAEEDFNLDVSGP